MKIRIGEVEYPVKTPDDLSLFDLIQLEQQTTAVGRTLTMPVLVEMDHSIEQAVAAASGAAAKRAARENHPDAPWMLAVTIWASRRAAGDAVSFTEAISFPLRELALVPEDGDPPADAVDPTLRRLRDSGAVGDRRPKSRKKTSAKASTAA